MAGNVDGLLAEIGGNLGADLFEARIVLPGDNLTKLIEPVSKKIRIGQGITQEASRVISTKSGIFQFHAPNRFWVANNQRRYIPRTGDSVIGTITDRHAEEYRLNIGASSTALLPTLAFDGASKRNKPNLQVGDLVYGRLVLASKDMEPELTCCAKDGQKKTDWVTGQNVYGELCGGTVFQCSLGLANRLRSPDSAVLNCLGRSVPFEVVIGANGMVWVNSETAASTIVVTNAIRNSEHLSDEQVEFMIRKLLAMAMSK